MKTLHTQRIRMLLLSICFISFLAACGNDVDPMPPNIDQDYLNPEAQERNLWVKGAVQSGVIAVLDDHSPFIIFSMSDKDFRAYLNEQGVSEAEFLASPNLRTFYATHVIGDAPGLIEKTDVEGAVVSAETLSGRTVTFENRDDGFDNGRGTVFVEGRELAEGALNENNTNYDWVLLHRPIIDFPLE